MEARADRRHVTGNSGNLRIPPPSTTPPLPSTMCDKNLHGLLYTSLHRPLHTGRMQIQTYHLSATSCSTKPSIPESNLQAYCHLPQFICYLQWPKKLTVGSRPTKSSAGSTAPWLTSKLPTTICAGCCAAASAGSLVEASSSAAACRWHESQRH
jgi:hypothetical protein